MIRRFLPFLDLADLRRSDVARELVSALTIAFLAVPQGLAYAMIAGMPPVMGLYASAVPAIVGAMFRSSRHVVPGPTNAVSLLVGNAMAAGTGIDPLTAGTTIAFLVGVMQAGAGLLSLGAIVDYISSSVVLGYITGAGVLIGVGQLGNLTGSPLGEGRFIGQIAGWAAALDQAHVPSAVAGVATIVTLYAWRRLVPKVPGTIVVMTAGIVATWAFDLHAGGMRLVSDIAPVPAKLPPFTVPDVAAMGPLASVAAAAALLSLVESSAVARNIATRSGQQLDTSVDFWGQGLANLSAAFTGGYPVSGSLSRSALNERAGTRTRLAAIVSGILLLLALLLLGPVVDLTPIPVLAGILVVVAVQLVDVPRIREIFVSGRSGTGDMLAFVGTLVGTWTMSLDKAILLGTGISLVLFLRRARLLVVRELTVHEDGRLREALPDGCTNRSDAIRILHVEGNLFFGAANELQGAIDDAMREGDPKVLVLRLKRTQGLDLTTASVLSAAHDAFAEQGRTLLLVGLRPQEMTLLEGTGLLDRIGRGDVYPTQPGWFVAMHQALDRAIAITSPPPTDPVRRYVQGRLGDPDDDADTEVSDEIQASPGSAS